MGWLPPSLIAPVVLAVAAAAGAAVTWSLPRWRARRNWRRAIDAVGPPVPPAADANGAPITIAGRLLAVGGVEHFADGSDVAATSFAYGDERQVTDRAAALAIETEGGRIDLEGGVDLLAGSAERHPGLGPRHLGDDVVARLGDDAGDRLEAGRRPVRYRRLVAGDRVRARGIIERIEVDGGERLAMVNAAITSEAPPSVSGPAPVVAIRTIAAATAVGLLAASLLLFS